MSFLGALAIGIEDAVGDEAMSVTCVAGKDLGKRLSAGAAGTDDIEKALDEVRRVLRENRCMWCFRSIPADIPAATGRAHARRHEVMLVFGTA